MTVYYNIMVDIGVYCLVSIRESITECNEGNVWLLDTMLRDV